MEIGHIELVRYGESVATELVDRLARLRELVDYNLQSGTALAEILRSFLREHTSGKYGVAEGFIANPFVKGAASKHCDILVYDQIQYPLLDFEGSIKVVLPRAAAMVVEVERNLDAQRLKRGYYHICMARQVYPYLPGILFAFDGLDPQALFSCMEEQAATWETKLAPIAVINIAKGFVAHRSLLSLEMGGGSSPFEVYDLKVGMMRSALSFFLLLYFCLQMQSMLAPGSLPLAAGALIEAAGGVHLGQIKIGV